MVWGLELCKKKGGQSFKEEGAQLSQRASKLEAGCEGPSGGADLSPSLHRDWAVSLWDLLSRIQTEVRARLTRVSRGSEANRWRFLTLGGGGSG